MFNVNSFVSPTFCISNLFGPTGRNDAMQEFNETWRAKTIPKRECVLVGRRDGTAGCFSLVPLTGRYDVAYYDEETPAEVYKGLVENTVVEFDPIFFQTDPTFKYVAMDLIAFLNNRGVVRKD